MGSEDTVKQYDTIQDAVADMDADEVMYIRINKYMLLQAEYDAVCNTNEELINVIRDLKALVCVEQFKAVTKPWLRKCIEKIQNEDSQ
jgi:phosphoribosylformylglycinamidine (FGAM) synthase PurS component